MVFTPANDPDFCSNGAKRCSKPLKQGPKLLEPPTNRPKRAKGERECIGIEPTASVVHTRHRF
jgi:hypothetical protein